METLEVGLASGRLRGLQRPGHAAFLGVPFAAPVTPTERFRAPQPARAWSGVRDATAFGMSCPQGAHAIPGFAASGPQAEDCLHLNIFTPAADNARWPVLLWVHGGGFKFGSGSEALYDGGPLAQRGHVVVVTVHYRLGALGFMPLGPEGEAWGATANVGLLDIVEALRWTRAHIEAFGGDPNNVTLFGESAGSVAVAALLAMPAAEGLFHKAIMQSGVGSPGSMDAASTVGQNLVGALGGNPASHASVAKLDVNDVVAAGLGAGPMGPVLDSATLPLAPLEAVRNGASARVPLLIGTNRDEQKLFNVSKDRAEPSDDELAAEIGATLATTAIEATKVIRAFRESRRRHGLPSANTDIVDLIETVLRFRGPSMRFAAEHARYQPDTYQYLFTHTSPAKRGALGACHALEMPFVFGTLDAPTQDRFAGTGPAVWGLAHRMMDAWVAFARTGCPNHPDLPDWPGYESGRRTTMMLDVGCEVQDDPFAAERQAIEPHLG